MKVWVIVSFDGPFDEVVYLERPNAVKQAAEYKLDKPGREFYVEEWKVADYDGT